MPGQTNFKIPVPKNVTLSYDVVISLSIFDFLKNKNPKFLSLLSEGSIIRVLFESGIENIIHVSFPSRIMYFSVETDVFNASCDSVEYFINFLSTWELCL